MTTCECHGVPAAQWPSLPERYRRSDVPHGLVQEPPRSAGAYVLAGLLALAGVGATLVVAVIAFSRAVFP